MVAKETLVSIIVPVYNVEQYLIRCIESIISQTYSYIDIILVNDGSDDESGRICDQYSGTDDRVRVFHKANGGLSDARNYGMDVAKGEYILFVDSDDFIEIDAVENLIEYAVKFDLDIVSGDSKRVINHIGNIVESTRMLGGTKSHAIMSGEQYLLDCIQNRSFSVAAWTRMYRTTLLIGNQIYFKKGLLHEDEQWTPRVLLNANRIGYLPIMFYNYIIRTNSITQTLNRKKHIEDIIATCKELEVLYNSLNVPKLHKRIYKDYLVKLFINTSTYGILNIKEYSKLVDKNFIIRNAFKMKTRIEVLVYLISIPLYRFIKLRFS